MDTAQSYLSVNVSGNVNGDGIRPRNVIVLVPPPRHHDGYVEPEDERERYKVALRLAVLRDDLEYPAAGEEHYRKFDSDEMIENIIVSD